MDTTKLPMENEEGLQKALVSGNEAEKEFVIQNALQDKFDEGYCQRMKDEGEVAVAFVQWMDKNRDRFPHLVSYQQYYNEFTKATDR